MQTVELKEFAQHLPDYLARVRSGETLLVLDQQQPVAEIKPVTPGTAARPFGLCRGEFVVPDDFASPCPKNGCGISKDDQVLAYPVTLLQT